MLTDFDFQGESTTRATTYVVRFLFVRIQATIGITP